MNGRVREYDLLDQEVYHCNKSKYASGVQVVKDIQLVGRLAEGYLEKSAGQPLH